MYFRVVEQNKNKNQYKGYLKFKSKIISQGAPLFYYGLLGSPGFLETTCQGSTRKPVGP